MIFVVEEDERMLLRSYASEETVNSGDTTSGAVMSIMSAISAEFVSLLEGGFTKSV